MNPQTDHSTESTATVTAAAHPWLWEFLRLLLGAAVVVALVVLVREHFGAFEALLARLGPWAPAVFVALHTVLVPCFFPVSVLGFTAGLSFGFWLGTAVLWIGGMLAASIMFWLARRVVSGRVRRYAAQRPRLSRFIELAEDDVVRLMVLLRLSPLNFALVSYLLGASRVRFGPYLLTSALVLPSAALQAYVGRTAREVGRHGLSGPGASPWQVGAAIVAVIAVSILALQLGRLARRALEADTAENEDGDPA